MEIFVDEPKLRELYEMNSCGYLDDDKVKGIVRVNRKEYVTTGSCSSHVEGIIYVMGNEIVDLVNYTDAIEPAYCHAHELGVRNGVRERGYWGRIANFKDRTIVLIGERVTFKCSGSGEQLNLF